MLRKGLAVALEIGVGIWAFVAKIIDRFIHQEFILFI